MCGLRNAEFKQCISKMVQSQAGNSFNLLRVVESVSASLSETCCSKNIKTLASLHPIPPLGPDQIGRWGPFAQILWGTVSEALNCLVVVVKSCPTLLQPQGLQPSRLLCPWDSPGKNTGVDCHFLLQELFPIQGLNSHPWHLLHWRQFLYN